MHVARAQVQRKQGENPTWESNLNKADAIDGTFEFRPRLVPLVSAYHVANGAEPQATNYVRRAK